MKPLVLVSMLAALSAAVSCGLVPGANSSAVSSSQPGRVYYADGQVRCVISNRNPSHAVNLVILGDGYTSNDLFAGGNADLNAMKVINAILAETPYSFYSNFMNAFIVYTYSAESGCKLNPTNTHPVTAYDSSFGIYGIDRLLVSRNYSRVVSDAAKAASNHTMIIVTANSTKYGGSGGAFSSISLDPNAQLVALHETGHSFGGLGDEYVDAASAPNYPLSSVAGYPNLETDTNQAKWGYFFGAYPSVGLYEGGYYRATGVWRPEANCMMRELSAPYCAVCREAIVKRILAEAGQPYLWSDFVSRNPPSSMPRRTLSAGRLPSDYPMFPDILPNAYH